MKQEVVVEKVIKELFDRKLMEGVYYDTIHEYLMQIYAAGWDEGRRQSSHNKRVIQFTKAGVRVGVHESATIAARAVGVTKFSISKAALGKINSSAGFLWRYE